MHAESSQPRREVLGSSAARLRGGSTPVLVSDLATRGGRRVRRSRLPAHGTPRAQRSQAMAGLPRPVGPPRKDSVHWRSRHQPSPCERSRSAERERRASMPTSALSRAWRHCAGPPPSARPAVSPELRASSMRAGASAMRRTARSSPCPRRAERPEPRLSSIRSRPVASHHSSTSSAMPHQTAVPAASLGRGPIVAVSIAAASV